MMATIVGVLLLAEPASSAKALFEEGRQHAKAGRAEQACTSFAASLEQQRALGTLMNLAACSEQLERLADAWRYADEAAALAERTHDSRGALARALQQRVERGVAFVEVHGDVLPSGAEAVVGGVSTPLAEPVTQVVVPAGELELVLRAPGQLTVSKRVVLGSKEVLGLTPWGRLDTGEDAQAFVWFASGPLRGPVKLAVLKVDGAFPYFGIAGNGCAGGSVYVSGVLEEPVDELPRWTPVVLRVRSAAGLEVGTSASFKQLRKAGLGRDRTPVLCEAGL